MPGQTLIVTKEDWARSLIETSDFASKRNPPPIPPRFAEAQCALRLTSPGRPKSVRTLEKRKRLKASVGVLSHVEKRAELLHGFAHHELQAAELFAWAVLAFPETPQAFRSGLLGLALDELRHFALYADHIASLGFEFGSFPIRDWFWEKLDGITSPIDFLIFLGVGLEGANLDHGTRFGELLSQCGDAKAAAIEHQVRDEEVAHVRFAFRWLRTFGVEDLTFDVFRQGLPKPLSPILFRGPSLERRLREDSGFTSQFLDALEQYR